jgi:hypothetical protein
MTMPLHSNRGSCPSDCSAVTLPGRAMRRRDVSYDTGTVSSGRGWGRYSERTIARIHL